MLWFALVPYVSVQVTWNGADWGRVRDWQSDTAELLSVNDTEPVGVPEPGRRTLTVAV